MNREISEMEKTVENAVLECKLASDKRWNKMEIEMQKVKDNIRSILEDKLPVMEARLNKQATMVNEIQNISINVASLSQNMQGMLQEIKAQNDRINTLEQKPVKRFEGVLDTIIKLVVTAAVTVILIKIGLK